MYLYRDKAGFINLGIKNCVDIGLKYIIDDDILFSFSSFVFDSNMICFFLFHMELDPHVVDMCCGPASIEKTVIDIYSLWAPVHFHSVIVFINQLHAWSDYI